MESVLTGKMVSTQDYLDGEDDDRPSLLETVSLKFMFVAILLVDILSLQVCTAPVTFSRGGFNADRCIRERLEEHVPLLSSFVQACVVQSR